MPTDKHGNYFALADHKASAAYLAEAASRDRAGALAKSDRTAAAAIAKVSSSLSALEGITARLAKVEANVAASAGYFHG